MALRRTSQVGASNRNSLGDPYQIYTEIVNAGKTIQSSKKKVRWLFGFTESDQEHEVILLHSLTSGKKTIYEDNREVTQSNNVLATDFSHGWNSERCNRILRVEVTINAFSETVYTFSIDGVRFVDMPHKPTGKATKTLGRYAQQEINSSHHSDELASSSGHSGSGAGMTRRPSAGYAGKSSQQPFKSAAVDPFKDDRGPFQSPVDPKAGSFDPFDSNSNNAFGDPFAASTSAHKQTSGGPKKPVGQTKPSPAISIFDSIDDEPMTSNANNHFDSFHNDKSFGSFSNTPSSVQADPFFGSDSTYISQQNKVDSTVNQKSNFDPFATSQATHHRTAQNISEDFAGLTFLTPPVASPPKAPIIPPAPVEEKEAPPKTTTSADPWEASKNLVNLDLTGKTVASAPARRTSNGPTLGAMMRQPSADKPTHKDINAILNATNDPFGAPALLTATPTVNNSMSVNHTNPQMLAPSLPPPIQYGRGLSSGPSPLLPVPANPNGMGYNNGPAMGGSFGMGGAPGMNGMGGTPGMGGMGGAPGMGGMGGMGGAPGMGGMGGAPGMGGMGGMGNTGMGNTGGMNGARFNSQMSNRGSIGGMSSMGASHGNILGNIPTPSKPPTKTSLDNIDWKTMG